MRACISRVLMVCCSLCLPVIQTPCFKAFLGIMNMHFAEEEGFSFVEIYSDLHILLLEIYVSPYINGFISNYFLFSSKENQ